MKAIIGGVRYNTETAVELANDRYWDGSNFERHGRNTHLYRGKSGRYFAYHTTQWQGERCTIEALDEDQARELYENLPEHEVEFEEAFPTATVEEA